ncbi:MAG: hypothetical protein FWE15_01690 [Actinomycetia bacterium]|nr:hypothetical protein [Actinomycetes bacterium]MCL2728718.1 hypothetical protein [Actinomycetes bacterium]
MSNGLKRAVARGAVAVALAAGAVVGAVGTASAAPMHHRAPAPQHCTMTAGHWTWVWHPAHRDRDHRQQQHAGYWTRVWQPAHRDCHTDQHRAPNPR